MDGFGDAFEPGPPPEPEPSSDGMGVALLALGSLLVALLVVLIFVLLTEDDGTGTAAETSTTQASTTSEQPTTTVPAATTAPPTTAAPTTTSAPSPDVVLPEAATIYNQPVDDAVTLLTAAGLAVDTAGIGCSNSTDPGMVRRVTVGSEQNVQIIYGKPTDTIDDAAASSLLPGDEVTVWTPSSNPCP